MSGFPTRLLNILFKIKLMKDDNINKLIGDKLVEIRKKKGLDQIDVSVGIDRRRERN